VKIVHLKAKAGEDRSLHLTVPVGVADSEFEVAVVLTPVKGNGPPESTRYPGWPEGYIESTAGSIQDETFVRHPQPVFPPAKVLD
jgi:hypothetical protein